MKKKQQQKLSLNKKVITNLTQTTTGGSNSVIILKPDTYGCTPTVGTVGRVTFDGSCDIICGATLTCKI